MPYIGNQPSESFTSFATQEFSTSATTSYTLDHAVTNENEIALFINNVRQQPGSGKAYTATGTALTLSAATASTDTMYCVFLGRALQTVNPAGGSIGSSQLSADTITGQTALAATPADTDEFLISDAGTLKRIDFTHIKGAGAGESNDPSFHAYNPQNGSVANNTTIIVSNNTELFDSSSAYNTSNYRFTPQVAGYYFLYSNIRYQSSTTDFDRINLVITKNGGGILAARNNNKDYSTVGVSGIVQANGSSDYFEMTSYQGSGTSVSITTDDEYTYFGGFLVKKT